MYVASWERAVPLLEERGSDGRPALAGAVVTVESDLLRRTFERLVDASRSAEITGAMELSRVLDRGVDLAALFAATVCDQRDDMTRIVGTNGGEAPNAILALVATPLLQACGRRSADLGTAWRRTYCPVCAAWPAFVEVRGIERARFARCGRCGSAWQAPLLACGYCGTAEHGKLVSLVPQEPEARGTIEACTVCRRYTKTIATLQGCAAKDVSINDLVSVDLDLAALEAGYTRPDGLGCALAVTVRSHAARPGLFKWART
jgi:FdhE protein